jgi:hypothetical protein
MGPPRKKDDPVLLEIVVAQTQDAPLGGPPAAKPLPMTYYTSTIMVTPTPPTQTDDFDPPDRTDHPKIYPPPNGPPYWMTSDTLYPPGSWVASTPTWTTLSRPTPLFAGTDTTASTTSPYVSDTSNSSSPTSAGYGNEGPSWHGRERMNGGGMYAAAAITPIVVLAMVGAVVFLCMRKRKRQRAGLAIVQSKAEEMKLHARSPPVTQAYMASPSIASPQYTVTDNHLLSQPDPAHLHPIILGPISSGINGAYFTGIDTSDVISMTSSNNIRPGPPNPFSDNDSLIEPPPPYRPRSAAPPSLTNSSRQSSLRNSTAPPATSRTHLIERSPFEDPFDDDAVSELSGPAAGHNDDTMSVVSDLSYQHDPVVNRSSL